ncbi:hypothetical protein FRC07_012709, partial [Ceratobasidium sp. 392]
TTSSADHTDDSEDEDDSDSDSEAPRSRPQRTWNISQQHIILDEELDVIPLICYLANYPPRKNVLCFVQDVKLFQSLERMGGRKVRRKQQAKRAIHRRVVSCFVVFSQPYYLNDPDRYNEQIDASKPRRATLILTQKELDDAGLSHEELSSEGYDLCLATAKYNDLTSRGKLTSTREQWRGQLSDSDNYGNLCRCFEAWIEFHYSGPHERSDWSATDVAKNANTFAKKALLHGNAKVEPRNPVHRTVGRRLSVTSQFVSDFGLEEPVRSKILVVEEFDE